jgi:hypothetical protein
MGPPAILPIRKEGVLRIVIALKKSIALAGFEPATFGSSDKYTNHYTTKGTLRRLALTLAARIQAKDQMQ